MSAPRASRRVLVVGGGVAGATAATLLGRAGNEVTLVERDQHRRSSGSPVDVRGSAVPVVRRLGLEERLRALDTGVTRLEFVDGRGRVRARAAVRRSSETDLELGRSALTGVLLEAAAEVAKVRFDTSPRALVQDEGGVEVTFEGGGTSRYDLVVGADGQHSRTRALVLGPEPGFTAPVGLGIATVPVDASLVDDPRTVRLHNVPGASLGIHPAGGHPVCAFIFRTDASAPPRSHEDQVAMVEHRYRSAGWRSAEMLQQLAAADDVYLDVVQRVAVPSWSRGRVVLLGDAASSITILGEGCSMAIAGAAVLADALAATPDTAAALADYERTHRPEVEQKQRGARLGAAVLVPRTAAGIALRDLAVALARRV
ncbi:FAD-dependent monooxygenase [Phycicoccus avicenniae]|uniref:FAD-dependent monooxygenase n=1 Tax=Phycicoccus avicenniae TaxID=2828860 RepID=UPI003D2C6D86